MAMLFARRVIGRRPEPLPRQRVRGVLASEEAA
jgi:hypothetical protein